MPTSPKIGIGAAITFVGLAGLFYIMPIVSNAAASNSPVFKEENVPELPDAMKMYVPLEFGAVGALIIGIAIMSIGLGETLSLPAEQSDNTKTKTKSRGNQDKESGDAEAA
jgi:hypothetical protein